MFGILTRRTKNLDLPHWLEEYQQHSFKLSASNHVDETEFVVLDCETTGLAKTDRIITIGAIKCTTRDISIDSSLDQKYPENSIGKSAEIHGELSSETDSNTNELIQELIEFLQNHIIVGHNIQFDYFMMSSMLKRTFGIELKNKLLDTAKLAIRLEPTKYERTVGGHSQLHLDDLCQLHGIQIENRHTALGDAFITAQLFQRLLTRLKKRGISKVGQLLN